MLKYAETRVTFEEVPSEVALCINITGCPIHCEGCHSPHLWKDTGRVLTTDVLTELIVKNEGITTICFMGGDAYPEDVYLLAEWVKENTPLKVCWYSGAALRRNFPIKYFDYLKTGPYKKELGGLDSIATNQRFYEIKDKLDYKNKRVLYRYLEDITWKFQKDEIWNNKDV
jgi:anaerobic ribonucleoside-triphosphate reductase activating protein